MQSKSIWSQTAKAEKRPRLEEDITCTACVIGGGMAGVLSAYFLTEQGVDTVLLEASSIGSGQTKNTTAKITSQHGSNTPILSMNTASARPDSTRRSIKRPLSNMKS